VESAPAMPAAMPPGVRGVRHDRDGQDGENEEERADHTDLRSPEAARPGRSLAGLPTHASEGSAGRQVSPSSRRTAALHSPTARLGALPSLLARKQRKVGRLKQLPTEKASGGAEDRALPG